jgi:ADP-heptose:LPS heptosyltransferase
MQTSFVFRLSSFVPCEMDTGSRGAMVKRIAVLRAGALGDFLLGISALRALREQFPAAHIVLAGPLPQARLALATGVVDELLAIDDPALAPLFDSVGEPTGSASDRRPSADRLGPVPSSLHGLDVAVVWLGRREAVAANLRRLSATEVIAAPPYSATGGAPHVADWLLGTLAPLGVHAAPDWDQTPWLTVPVEAGAWAAAWRQNHTGGKDYALLHPGTGSARKNWPAKRWGGVIGALRKALDVSLVITAGPADDAALSDLLVQSAAARWRPPVVSTDLDVFQLAALVEGACLYLGNDSGVTHLAAGLGTPTVAVFGPTNPDVWRPRGPYVRVLGGNHKAGVDGAPLIADQACWPEVEQVVDAAEALTRSTLPRRRIPSAPPALPG